MDFNIQGNWGDITAGFVVGVLAERLGRWAYGRLFK